MISGEGLKPERINQSILLMEDGHVLRRSYMAGETIPGNYFRRDGGVRSGDAGDARDGSGK